MESSLCKIQYVGKAETAFNILSNNNRSGVSDANASPACHHFAPDAHNFNTYTKVALIEPIVDKSKPVK